MSRVVPIDLLNRLLRYDANTGEMHWLERPVSMFSESVFRHRTGKVCVRSSEWSCRRWNTCYAGKPAFTALNGAGARQGRINGESLYAHRVAWALHHGEWPSGEIDHINGNRSDNRISNLRDVDHQTNMQNKAVYRTNSSGCHGVSRKRSTGRWQAAVTVDGKRIHLGSFEARADAIAARKTFENQIGFHKNHGRAA